LRKAVFTFELGTPQNRAVLAALGPEASRDVPRATAIVRVDGPRLHLEITAQDSASLRAAVNSYLRWVKLAAGAARAGTKARKTGEPGNRATGQPGERKTGKNGNIAGKQ
jgi:tRNA threonylcarbamoyladenosine modification (KEOPS) complex  Pcc1 subunit